MGDRTPLSILKSSGALLPDDHFRLTSLLHSRRYVESDFFYLNPLDLKFLAEDLAVQSFRDHIDVVVGPATGGGILATLVAIHLSRLNNNHLVKSVFADKETNGGQLEFLLRPTFKQAIQNKRVLVVDDVLTSGGSARALIRAVNRSQGVTIAIGVICQRKKDISAEDLGVNRLFSLVQLDMVSYRVEECPMCREGIPINLEHGHE